MQSSCSYGTFWVSNVIRVHKGPTHFPQLWWPYEYAGSQSPTGTKKCFILVGWSHCFDSNSFSTNFTLVQNALSEYLWEWNGLTSYFWGVIFAITYQLMMLVERLDSIGFLGYRARIFKVVSLLLFNRHRTYFRIFTEIFPLRTWLTIVRNLWFLPN